MLHREECKMKKLIFLSTFIVFMSGILLSIDDCDCCRDIRPDESYRIDGSSVVIRNEYSIDELRELLSFGETIYQILRVICDIRGTMSYRVPVRENDVEYIIEYDPENVLRNNPFPVTKILIVDSQILKVLL
jgi:hypothetical protein